MQQKGPSIILVGTQMAVNIGMCARAMLNCGLTDLRLVTPRDGWPNDEAIAPATGARHIIENARCFDTLDEAISDCTRVLATSARVRGLEVPTLGLRDAVSDIGNHISADSGHHCGILFGPEASGLDNDSLCRADRLINFQMNPDFTSLNLAQAVLLFGWEWWNSSGLPQKTAPLDPGPALAPRSELEGFLQRLETELENGGFFPNPLKRPSTMKQLRTYFTRSQPTDREIKGLHGIITSLLKSR